MNIFKRFKAEVKVAALGENHPHPAIEAFTRARQCVKESAAVVEESPAVYMNHGGICVLIKPARRATVWRYYYSDGTAEEVSNWGHV